MNKVRDILGKGERLKAFSDCVWKECPDSVSRDRRYSVVERNPRVATKTGDNDEFCTAIGSTLIPANTVSSWTIKILKSKDNNGSRIYIGVAPFDIDQNDDYNVGKIGWFFYCYYPTLFSGPPHKYWGRTYGPRKREGEYVHSGDSVRVVMDTTKGELSFGVNETDYGVAYTGIPLDKPLVPCVAFRYKGDSVELIV